MTWSVRSSRRTLVIGIVIMVVGALALLYPYAADILNRVEASKVAVSQSQAVASVSEKDLSAQWKRARAYNRELLSGAAYVVDPFDPNAPSATGKEYLSCLNLNGDGVMGQIVIPKIGVNLPIYHGTEGDFMEHGVGHVVNTSLPVGGADTHSVLAAHTGVPGAVLFDGLDQLQVGDYFVLKVLGKDLAYRVYATEVVLPDDTSSLAVQKGRDLVTLVTCTPYGVNTHRLLVHAERCAVPSEFYQTSGGLPPSLVSLDAHMPPSLLEVVLVLLAVIALVFAARWAAGRWRARRSGRGPS